MRKSCVWLVVFGLGSPIWADASDAAPVEEWTAYYARRVDADTLDILPKALRGELVWQDMRLFGGGYWRQLATPTSLQRAFDALGLPQTRIGAEFVAVQHRGEKRNAEVDAALALRFGRLPIGRAGARFGYSLGLSYAIGTPTYDDGPRDDPDRRYRLQIFVAYELALDHASLPGWALVGRLHHRSGLYGVIAPMNVGSNFVGLGLRRVWP